VSLEITPEFQRLIAGNLRELADRLENGEVLLKDYDVGRDLEDFAPIGAMEVTDLLDTGRRTIIVRFFDPSQRDPRCRT